MNLSKLALMECCPGSSDPIGIAAEFVASLVVDAYERELSGLPDFCAMESCSGDVDRAELSMARRALLFP